MFQWNEEMVRFMRDASEYSDYHRRLVQWMLPDLHPGDHICDAGCGLGYLSLALSPYVRRVTAADRSQEALSVLRENCTRRAVQNIDIRSGDICAHPPDAAYDAMAFCFFGAIEEVAAIARDQCRGTVFVFKKHYATHRFSVGSHPPDMKASGRRQSGWRSGAYPLKRRSWSWKWASLCAPQRRHGVFSGSTVETRISPLSPTNSCAEG